MADWLRGLRKVLDCSLSTILLRDLIGAAGSVFLSDFSSYSLHWMSVCGKIFLIFFYLRTFAEPMHAVWLCCMPIGWVVFAAIV